MLIKRLFASELLRGSFGYLLASIATSAVPFILLPVLTRYLTPAEYGEVAMFSVWMSLLAAFCGLSVHGAATRKYFDHSDDPRELSNFIFMCLVILAASTLFFSCIVIIFGAQLSDLLELDEKWLILGVACAGAKFVTQIRLGQWQARKQVQSFVFLQSSQALANLLISLVLVTVFYLSASGRIMGIATATIAFGFVALWLLYRDNLVHPTWQPRKAREALLFGVPLIPHLVGGFLLDTVDRVVVTNELGVSQAGIYMVALQVSMAVTIILEAVNRTFLPWLFERLKRDDPKEKRNVVKVTYFYFSLLAAGVAISFLWADDVLKLITGPEYAEAADIVAWVILGKALHGGYLMVTNYLFYTKRTGALSSIMISTGIINVGLLVVFIEYWGLLGVAWAQALSKLLQWLITWFFANKSVPMPWLLRQRVGT